MILKKKILVFHSPSRQATSRLLCLSPTDLRSGTGFNGTFPSRWKGSRRKVPFSRRSTLWTMQQWYASPSCRRQCPARRSSITIPEDMTFRVIETIALHQKITTVPETQGRSWQSSNLIPTVETKVEKCPVPQSSVHADALSATGCNKAQAQECVMCRTV